MVLNAFESIATSFSDNRKKLKENGLAAELAPTPPPPPLTPAPVATPVITPPIKPPPPVPAPTQMPTEIAVTLGALQQRGEQFGVDTTEFNYAAPDWNKVVAQMGEVNKVFDIMESDIDRPATPGPRAWEQGLGSGISQVLGDNFPQLFAESNPDASFWDRSLGRTIGATGRGLRQTIGRPALGVSRAIGEHWQKQLPIPEETIADLARPQEQKIADIFSDLGVIEPEQWHEFVEREGQIKADLLISRRLLAQMGSASWEIGTQATSEWSDEENLARNQYRIQRLLEIDPATGKTRAEGQLRNATNPAVLAGIALAMFEASEGVVTLGGRIALSQLGRQIDIANGGDGSKGEMWGDIIGSFIGGFPKNPTAGARVGAGAGTVYRNADEVAAGLRAIDRPVQQGAGIAGATGFDFAASEMRDLGQLAKIVGTPVLKAGRLAGTSALQAGEQAAAAVGRTGVDNVLDPAPPPVSRGMAGGRTTRSALDTPVGERATVFDPAGNPSEVTVTGRSEMGAVEVTLDDGTTRLLGDSELGAVSPYSPDYVVDKSGWNKSISDITDLELKEASARVGKTVDRIKNPDKYPDEKGLILGEMDWLRDDNALRLETRRRAGEAVTDPAGVFTTPAVPAGLTDVERIELRELSSLVDEVAMELTPAQQALKNRGLLQGSPFSKDHATISPMGRERIAELTEKARVASAAPIAPVADDIPAVKAPRVTIRNVNKALADAGHDAKVHKGKDYIYFSGNDVGGWMQTSVSVPRLTDDLGLDTPATVDNWVKEFERMKASPDVNPDAAIEANRARYAPESILPEGGILGDDFGKAPEGTVVTIDGVETRIPLRGTADDTNRKITELQHEAGETGMSPEEHSRRLDLILQGKDDAIVTTGRVVETTDPAAARVADDPDVIKWRRDYEIRRDAARNTEQQQPRGTSSMNVIRAQDAEKEALERLRVAERDAAARVAGVPRGSVKLTKLQKQEITDDMQGSAEELWYDPEGAMETGAEANFLRKFSDENGNVVLPDTISGEDLSILREYADNAASKISDMGDLSRYDPEDLSEIARRRATARSLNSVVAKIDALPVDPPTTPAIQADAAARVADDIPTEGQATLEGGVVPARTEQDIIDARTKQSGFDLTATGEDAPLRQAQSESVSPAVRSNPVVSLANEPPVITRIRNESPGGGSAQLSEAEQIELRDWLRQNGTDFQNSKSVGGVARGSMGQSYGGDAQIIIGSYKSDVPGFDRQLIAWNPADGGFRTHNTMPDAQSQRITRARMKNFGTEATLGTPGEGSARTIEIFSDDIQLPSSGKVAQPNAITPPAPADEVIINGKKYVEAPETPAEPVARAGGVIEPPPALFLPKSADEAAARLNADADDDWTYVVHHDPKNTGGSRIDILDEGGERVGPVTDEIAKGDYAFVYNDAGDRVRIDLIEGDEAFYTSANKRTRKPVDRAAIESQLAPAAPEPPVAADPKFESQHGFNDDGTLTTFESQATEGIEQFDDQLAKSEMRLPKTQAELDADLLPSKAEMDAYFDEEQYLHDFSDGSTVDNAPMFETRHPDTPLGNAERKVDELEKELEGQAEYELEIEMEAIRDEIDQSPLAPLMEAFDGRQAEEGLYPDQYYKIFGDGGVRLIPTGKKGNVIQRDYITWALKAHPRDFKADRMVNKVFGAERRALSQKRNWTIGLEHTDEISEQYRTAPTQTYAQNPDADNFEADIPKLLNDIKHLRSQRDRLRDYDANIKGIQLEKAEELKEAKRQELLAANDEVILQQGIVEPVRGSLNAEGAAREFSEASRIPQVGTETRYVDAEGNTISFEEAFESDVLDIGAVSAHNISIQNPANFSDPVIREQAERYIRDIRGPYTPEEVAELSDFALGRLVAENISTQNPRRGTIGPGGKGVRPDVAKPVIGTGDPVEQGLEYPVAGTSRATQSSMAETERSTRIQPSKGLPYKINSPDEADRALGAVYNPNPEIKVQVAAANLRGTIESGAYRTDAEDAFVRSMPGEDISLTKEMYTAVDEQNIDDIGSRAGFRLDPGRIANTGDQGQSIGPVTNSIIETTQRLDDGSRVWGDAALRDWDRLLKKYRIRKASVFKLKRNNDLERFTIIMERLSGNDVMRLSSNPRLAKEGIEEFVPAEELLNKPSIKKAVQGLEYNDRIRFIQAAQDGRIFLDNLRLFQNRVRGKRGQKLIPLLPDYMPHIRRMTLWRKFGGLYEGADMKNLDMLDFTAPPDIASTPGYAFNPRALARKWGLKDDVRELNADKLVRSYITTAMKDVFHTEIDRNIKANTRHWRKATKDDYSLKNIADAFDTYSAEAYLGVPSRASKFIRDLWIVNRRLPLGSDRALPSFVDATVMLKRMLTRTVFPFNWTWNTFIQTSSGLLTPVRYGVRNSIRAIDAITSSSVKEDIDKFAYVARTKGRRGNSVVLQDTADDVFAYSEDMPWQDRALEWASFLSIQIEKHLTRHAIRAAYLRGQKLGYEGAELWQYASQGGARTQSMYNKADTVGALRSRELSAVIPFQTFAFEMFNTLAETNIPIFRKFTGKLGAYESFGANTARGKATAYGRLKNLAIWFAGAVAINAIADRASNRKPWNASSFIPGWALLSGGVNGLGPGSAILPAKFLYDVTKAAKASFTHGNHRGMASIGLRYFGLPGGTQIDKMWGGAEAVQEGVVRNLDRTTKFEVDAPEMIGIKFDIPLVGEVNVTDAKINPEEFIKTYGQGIWSTNGGQEYLDQQLGRSREGQSTFGKIRAEVFESAGFEGLPLDMGGAQGKITRDIEEYLDAYYIIPTDPDVRKERGLPSRTTLRKKNPELDARLFAAGKVSTLSTGPNLAEAKRIAKELIVEYGLLEQGGGFFTGRGVDQEQENIFRKVLGDRWVDSIIGGAGNAPSSTQPKIREGYVPLPPVTTPAERQSSAPRISAKEGERLVRSQDKTPTEQWRLVSNYLTRENLVALQKIWDGKAISRAESSSLKAVFEKEPLGQTNFRTWSKQTLRQIQENSAVQMSREAVTV